MISLKEICLTTIVRHIERFYNAFTVSENEILKMSLEFLQRNFSFKLVSKLFINGKLKEEYIRFLIHQRLILLDSEWLDSNNSLTSELLRHLPNLKILMLSKNCSDEILAIVAKCCPKVVKIDMTHSHVTDNGLKYLCKDENGIAPCPELKYLFVKCSKVTDEGVEYLIRNLPSLENIDYKNVPEILYSINKEKLPRLEGVQSCNLVELNLLNSSPENSNLLKVCLISCPKLKSIACNITDEKELSLFDKSSIESYHLKFLETEPKMNINKLLGTNTTILKLYNCIMSVADLAEGFPKLKQLYVKNISFLNDKKYDKGSQPRFPHLQKCVFQKAEEQTESTDKAIRFLLLLSPKLESISFIDFNLSQDIKISILKCCENCLIKEITFQDFIIELSFVKGVLESCCSLKTLNLPHCYLNDYDQKELYEFVNQLSVTPGYSKPSIHCCNLFDFSDSDSEEESSDSLNDSTTSSENGDEE